MNEKQKIFADEYIILKNATEAAKRAGYSEKTAYSQGQRLLKNVEISNYIKTRTEELFSERTMSVAEALALTASIARGEPQKGSSKQFDKLTGQVTKDVEYEYTPSIEERQKSLEHILKTGGAFDTKQTDTTGESVTEFYFDRGEMF